MMKVAIIRLVVLSVALAVSFSLGGLKAFADLEISAQVQVRAATDFYDPLAVNGAWVDVGGYGHCWHPANVARDWRPYCQGTWVWTDDGWYWESDEPWAWACYHYGSWVDDPQIGWVWIPGVEWAPAWVYWREGGGHIGWAPCGPQGASPAESTFVFVEERHFHEWVNPATVTVNNTTIINNTTELRTNTREQRSVGGVQRSVMVNSGPDINQIEKASGKEIKVVSIQQEDSRIKVPATMTRRKDVPQEKTPQTPPADYRQPVTTPNKVLPSVEVPEAPHSTEPSDKNLPPPRNDFSPPTHAPEVPLVPQPNRPANHELIPQPQSPPREVQPIHPVVPSAGNDKVQDPGHDKEKDKNE